jgi:hypothetical protein
MDFFSLVLLRIVSREQPELLHHRKLIKRGPLFFDFAIYDAPDRDPS